MFLGLKYWYFLRDTISVLVSSIISRFQAISGYGYTPSRSAISAILKPYKDNGGIPDLLHVAGVSVNDNVLTFTTDFTNAVWNKSGTTATTNQVTFDTNAGSIIEQSVGLVSSPPTWAAMKVRMRTLTGTKNVRLRLVSTGVSLAASGDLTVTTTPQDFYFSNLFTGVTPNVPSALHFVILNDTAGTAGTIVVDNIQGEISTDLVPPSNDYYTRTDSTTVKSLNLGSNGATGDGTYTNGATTTMLSTLSTGPATKYLSTSSQYISTSSNLTTGNFTIKLWALAGGGVTNRGLIYNTGTGIGRMNIQLMNNGKVGWYSGTTLTQSVGTYTTGQWIHIALVKTATNQSLYINGGLDTSITISATHTATPLIIGADTGNSDYMNGSTDYVSYTTFARTAQQIQNIFNAQKSRFGL